MSPLAERKPNARRATMRITLLRPSMSLLGKVSRRSDDSIEVSPDHPRELDERRNRERAAHGLFLGSMFRLGLALVGRPELYALKRSRSFPLGERRRGFSIDR